MKTQDYRENAKIKIEIWRKELAAGIADKSFNPEKRQLWRNRISALQNRVAKKQEVILLKEMIRK